jgi:hypothetical protein
MDKAAQLVMMGHMQVDLQEFLFRPAKRLYRKWGFRDPRIKCGWLPLVILPTVFLVSTLLGVAAAIFLGLPLEATLTFFFVVGAVAAGLLAIVWIQLSNSATPQRLACPPPREVRQFVYQSVTNFIATSLFRPPRSHV